MGAALLIIGLVYIFAIVMLSALEDYKDELLQERFENLPTSMWTLFVDCTLLDGIDGIGGITKSLLTNKAYFAFGVMCLFMLMSAMIVMNICIGVCCGVVSTVAVYEKEDSAVRLVKENILVVLTNLDEDGSGDITKDEMSSVLRDEATLLVLDKIQVDMSHLVDYLDMHYDVSAEVSIQQIMDLILMLRGDRMPTMRDMLHGQMLARWKMNHALDMSAVSGREARRPRANDEPEAQCCPQAVAFGARQQEG